MKFYLRNVIEELVRDKAEELIKKEKGLEFNQKNFLDVCAIVLNNIPPKYVVTIQGEAYTKIDFLKIQYKVDIITEIIKAIEIVMKNPKPC